MKDPVLGVTFVASLPDLIDASEYAEHPEGNLVRLRIEVTDGGVVLTGDAMRPVTLEALLAALGDGTVEQMLCG
jgi:FtsH ternary system-associated peptide